MQSEYRILLIESDDYSVEVLQRSICWEFPHVKVDPVSPQVIMPTLEGNHYDIIICDAHLGHHERISLIADLCRQDSIFLIVITGDTDLRPDTFSPSFSGNCIHQILYKPLDLKVLLNSVQCAILRTKARRAETK